MTSLEGWASCTTAVLGIAIIGPASSCTHDAPPTESADSAAPSQTAVGMSNPECPTRVSPDRTSRIPEIRGRSASTGITLFGLSFHGYPIPAGREAKLVWRMTGSGAFSLVAIGPQGQEVAPLWGPEAHPSSNWKRPGDEWGTGLLFPEAGCWTVRATRGGDEATASILVIAP